MQSSRAAGPQSGPPVRLVLVFLFLHRAGEDTRLQQMWVIHKPRCNRSIHQEHC